MTNAPLAAEAFQKLVDIVAQLRDPVSGCPWDKEQTHHSLKSNLIEESYEVIDAIDQTEADPQRTELKKELGDLLLQVLLHSQIAADDKVFQISGVVEYLSDKLVRRHPHVFGDSKAENSQQALQNWEKQKEKELPKDESILKGVPKHLPALVRAQRVSEKAARVGFEWANMEDIRSKVLEEVQEFAHECIQPDVSKAKVEDEFGDVFFALIQLARRLHLDAENCLQQSTNKFVRRFQEMEKRAAGKISDTDLQELNRIWEEIKKEEKK